MFGTFWFSVSFVSGILPVLNSPGAGRQFVYYLLFGLSAAVSLASGYHTLLKHGHSHTPTEKALEEARPLKEKPKLTTPGYGTTDLRNIPHEFN